MVVCVLGIWGIVVLKSHSLTVVLLKFCGGWAVRGFPPPLFVNSSPSVHMYSCTPGPGERENESLFAANPDYSS